MTPPSGSKVGSRLVVRFACVLAIALSAAPSAAWAAPPKRVTYHNGALLTRPQIYIDFWGPGWTKDPLHERSYLINFVSSMNGSRWLETLGQYHIGWQHTTYKGSWSDPALSHRPGPNPSKSATEAEVRRAALHFGIVNDRNALIIVALPAGGTCNAYHDWEHEFNVAFAAYPYNSDPGCAGGAQTVSHEIAEAMTDPQPGSGWTPEIADPPCQEAGNVRMPDGKVFFVQKLWSNNANACVLTS